MAGVKLHHPDLRSCVFTVIHEGRRLTRRYDCPLCLFPHFDKTYHLFLDSLGDVTVSEQIYARLVEADLRPLVARTEVPKPERARVVIRRPIDAHAGGPMIDQRARVWGGTRERPTDGKEIVIAREGRRIA